MSRPNALPKLMAVALIAIAAGACADYKTPAEEAIVNIDEKMAGIHVMAEKYLPEELASVQAQIDELKAGVEQKEYEQVVATAPRVLKAVNSLIVNAAVAKGAHATKMQNDWAAFATDMPNLIASVDKQIVRYTSRGSLPKGMSRDAFKETVATFDAAKASWAEAATAGNDGKFEEAVNRSNEVKQVVDTVMQTLGISTG